MPSGYRGMKFFFECGTLDEAGDRNNNGIIDSIDDTKDLISALVDKGYDPLLIFSIMRLKVVNMILQPGHLPFRFFWNGRLRPEA